MEFSEKLKALRAEQGLTQEQLAQRLYVTRTAVSRWETGTGTPNLDSLQALARLFGVSVDDLLSTDALITLAQDERRTAVRKSSLLAFGLLDALAALSLLLPLFGVHEESFVRMASLLEFGQATGFGVAFMPVAATLVALGIVGIVELVLAFGTSGKHARVASLIGFALQTLSVFALVATMQPYAAAFVLALLVAKAVVAYRSLRS